MTPLQPFAQTVTAIRKVFDASRDTAAWLVFYEAKQVAYDKLVAALPQIKEIEDFWHYVQNIAPAAWLPIIEDEILRITQCKHLCGYCVASASMRSIPESKTTGNLPEGKEADAH